MKVLSTVLASLIVALASSSDVASSDVTSTANLRGKHDHDRKSRGGKIPEKERNKKCKEVIDAYPKCCVEDYYKDHKSVCSTEYNTWAIFEDRCYGQCSTL